MPRGGGPSVKEMKKSYPKRRDPLIHVALRGLCWAFVVGAMFGLSATFTRISHRFSTRMVHYYTELETLLSERSKPQLEQFAVKEIRNRTTTTVSPGQTGCNARRVGSSAKGRTVARRIPLAAYARTVGRYFRGRSPGERVQPTTRISAPEQLPHERQRNNLDSYGVGPLCDDLSFAL